VWEALLALQPGMAAGGGRKALERCVAARLEREAGADRGAENKRVTEYDEGSFIMCRHKPAAADAAAGKAGASAPGAAKTVGRFTVAPEPAAADDDKQAALAEALGERLEQLTALAALLGGGGGGGKKRK